MLPLNKLAISPWAEHLGWVLLHSVWQGALIAGVLAISLFALRRASANARYTVAYAALILMLLFPLATLCRLLWANPLADAANQSLAAEIPAATNIRESRVPALELAHNSASKSASTLPTESDGAAAMRPVHLQIKHLLPWLAAAWFVGVAALSLRLALGGWRIHKLRRAALRPATESMHNLLKRLTTKLHVSWTVRLIETALVEVPTVIGWLRPVILLPAMALTGLSCEQLESLLAHEPAHIRRHDYLANLLQTAIETLLFYHPAVWWVSACIRQEREHCCDDLAISVCGNRLLYAKSLLQLEELRAATPQLALTATGGKLLPRIQRIVSPPASAQGPAGYWLAGLVTIAATVILSGWALSAEPQSQAAQQSVAESKLDAAPPPVTSATITGTCVDENGQPLADARARLFSVDHRRADASRRELAEVRTNEEGKFTFNNVALQTVRDGQLVFVVTAQSPGKQTFCSRPIEPDDAGKAPLDVKMPAAATLQGRVVDTDGQPVSALVYKPTVLREAVDGIHAALTDKDGCYAITDLEPFDVAKQKPIPTGNGGFIMMGESFLHVQHPDFARQRATYKKAPATVDITLQRKVIVEGRIVLAESNEPAKNVQLVFSSERADSARTKTDEDGKYRLATLPAGEYRMSAALAGRPNLFKLKVHLKPGTNSLDLSMEKGALVEGRVIDAATGGPVVLGEGESMSLMPGIKAPNGATVTYSGMDHARVQPDGTFKLYLPAGRPLLGMYLGPHWKRVGEHFLLQPGFEVREGEVVKVELTVEKKENPTEKKR